MDSIQLVEQALADIRKGKMVILTDDEDRENEGDLVMAAQHVTPEAINFMATHARGLICLTLTEQRIAQLGLPLMVTDNTSPYQTAFTVSIEAAKGVTTGISAADRAHTIRVAVKPDARPTDVVTPGHVFPLKARRGGVLVRTGQTEGSVDLARLAGFRSAGVICEIMKDDGTMARMPDLEEFGREHGLRILSIADLIQYRLQTETLVRRVAEYPLLLDQTRSEWRAVVYESLVDGRQALALLKGSIDAEPLLCRVHTGSSVADLFASTSTDGGETLRQAIDLIEQEGRGALLYLESQRSLAEELTHAMQSPRGAAPPAAESASSSSDRVRATLRRFGLGAQMLADLGARKLRLLTTSQRKIAGLTGYGIEIVEHVSLHANERG